MKRYIRSSSDSAVKKFLHRAAYQSKMQGAGEEIEARLQQELDRYLQLNPEYAENWYDEAAGCRIVPPRMQRFYPSRALKQFASANGFELRRATSTRVPDYDWYVVPID